MSDLDAEEAGGLPHDRDVVALGVRLEEVGVNDSTSSSREAQHEVVDVDGDPDGGRLVDGRWSCARHWESLGSGSIGQRSKPKPSEVMVVRHIMSPSMLVCVCVPLPHPFRLYQRGGGRV